MFFSYVSHCYGKNLAKTIDGQYNKSVTAEKMDHDCEEALRQIVDQKYAAGLEGYQVFCYGIAFYQKSALVKKL